MAQMTETASSQDQDATIQELARHADVLMQKNHALAAALNRASKQLRIAKSQLAGLSNPPLTVATFRAIDGAYTDDDGMRHTTALVLVSGRLMSVGVAGNVNTLRLKAGQQVVLNDNLILCDTRELPATGAVRIVDSILPDGRLQVADQSGALSIVLRSGCLADTPIKVGAKLCVDTSGTLALEVLGHSEDSNLMLEEVPDITFEDIGGLDEQIAQIRDTVELPFAFGDAFRRYQLVPPRGVLLYGPPGNGKTLIAKAVAHALAERQGGNGVFLSVKGPQLLSKYVGESERLLREMFERARNRARDGRPVVVFIDEMDSLLRTRGSGVSSDVETTIVPQFLAELDGVESLHNVVVIGASNRIDMIDPAVLRPGRLDIKVHVSRPDSEQAASILRRYITNELPLEQGVTAEQLIAQVVQDTMAHTSSRLVCQLEERNPQNQSVLRPIYFGDLLSGAILRNIVDRAKTAAVKATIAGHAAQGAGSMQDSTDNTDSTNNTDSTDSTAISETDTLTYCPITTQLLHQAVEREYEELTASVSEANPAQWARLNDIATEGDIVSLIAACVR